MTGLRRKVRLIMQPLQSTGILVPFGLFIFRFFFFFCCIVVGTDLESKRLALFYKLACEMHFVSF